MVVRGVRAAGVQPRRLQDDEKEGWVQAAILRRTTPALARPAGQRALHHPSVH